MPKTRPAHRVENGSGAILRLNRTAGHVSGTVGDVH